MASVPEGDGFETVDTGLTRAADQTIGQPTPAEAAALDARLREFEAMRRRGEATAHTSFVGIPHGLYEGANRYDTDDTHTLTLWRDGQTYDLVAPAPPPPGGGGAREARERGRRLAKWTEGYSRRHRPDIDPDTWHFVAFTAPGTPPFTLGDLRALLSEGGEG